VLSSASLKISFQCALTRDKWDASIHLVQRLMSISLTNEPNMSQCKLHVSGKFSVKSMYSDLMNSNSIFGKKFIWKLKIPIKMAWQRGNTNSMFHVFFMLSLQRGNFDKRQFGLIVDGAAARRVATANSISFSKAKGGRVLHYHDCIYHDCIYH
jgi:hypothetical protein